MENLNIRQELKKRLKNHYAKLLLSCDYFEKYTGFKTKLKNH